ncbi:PREDICTED: uncharacterized protein LOC104597425 [Nelumbo nucifera]|uniref:Uncharacterized protein LOC104597425 n=2 Tax=Nelumbo nucifera TaxID=4432 RepID=A0A1U8A728_NELNU|nr:PREDICTED: uncharacterized protein LOC104597425 [Nelumbo nucifera]DAD42345.1 TPA_asm: hypothetical protein HUJ06_000575 [Nelumbo nucifera]
MANHHRIDGEDPEALFSSYPCAVYYVQSPSSVSHANSSECRNPESAFLSPFRSESFITNPTNTNQEVARFTLSRYSSSRGSTNSFLHEKKMAYDLQSHETGTENGETRPIICADGVEDDDRNRDYFGHQDKRKRGCWKYFSFSTSSSCAWIAIQISWRILVSFGAALLVFFIATKPSPPKMSVKMAGIRQFGLGEGVDNSGVTTKILTCNCSMDLSIDNRSKLFRLHIRPPTMEMSFGHLLIASSEGPKLYAETDASTTFQLYVGTKNKAMYGAGRSMQDMLESGKGLPLLITMRLSSSFQVVWNLIRPTFHHHAECLLFLDGAYDTLHHTQAYNSSCSITSYS